MFEDGAEYKVLKQIKHPDYDCGFLLIGDCDKPALKFDFVGVQRGEEIFTLGNPSGMTFISTKGVVTGRTDSEGYFGDTLLIVVDSVAHGGNSGSVLLDTDGEIRGVHVGGYSSRCGSSLHGYEVNICVNDILNALKVAGLELN